MVLPGRSEVYRQKVIGDQLLLQTVSLWRLQAAAELVIVA